MGKPRTPPEFMSKRKKNDLAMPVSWRSLKPSSSRKSSSRIAVRKRLIMASRLFIGSVILLLGGFFLSFQINETSVHVVGQSDYTGPSQPIDQVVFRSDGALNHKWFLNWMGPLRDLSLAEINLKKLQLNLLEEDQILSVKVKRKFPSTLEISIQEREPLLVLRLRDSKVKFKDWLVSADGCLYEGAEYSPSMLRLLPSLKIPPAIIERYADDQGYKKLKDIPVVAPLLELARSEYPEIFRDWTVVSYHRPSDKDPGANITVNSKRVGKIRFHPSNYASQLRRLRYLLDEPKFSQAHFIRSIDLSHGRSVFAKI